MSFEKFLHSGHYFIDEIKYLSKKGVDRYFFSPDNMRFFNSRVNDIAWKIIIWEVEKYYFITSEKNNNKPSLCYDLTSFINPSLPKNYPRLYTVRSCDHKGNIKKISKFQEFKTLYHARRFLYNFILNTITNKNHYFIKALKK